MYTLALTFLTVIKSPHGSIYMFNNGVTLITVLTHKEFSISLMFLSFAIIGGHILYNSSLFTYFNILGAELITASCKIISDSNSFQPHSIGTQEDKYIQLIYFLF